MTTPEQRSKFRDFYYKHHDRYKAAARARSAKQRREHPETPEEAEQRRAYMRAWHANRRGDIPPEYFAGLSDKEKTTFKLIVIGLLNQRAEKRRLKRLAWRRKHEFDWKGGSRPPKQPAQPSAPKEARQPLTAEEIEERRLRRNERQMQIRRERLADPKWKAEFNSKKRNWSKRVLVEAKEDPAALAGLRAKRRAANKRWVEKIKLDPAKYQQYLRREWEYERNLRGRSIHRKLSTILRNKVYIAIRRQQMAKKSYASDELVGCTVAELMKHLEAKFQPGMSWRNFGRGTGKWSIDHIRPCASFDLRDPVQQKQCFHFSNLQPLWSVENSSKGSRWNERLWSHSDHACQPTPPVQTPAT